MYCPGCVHRGHRPLVIASGAGSASRHSLGTPVFGGMILSTVLNLFLVPVIYVMIVNLRERGKPRPLGGPTTARTPTANRN